MNLPDLTQFIEPTTLIICLCVGYVIKETKPFEKVANDFIPIIELGLGVICTSIGAFMSSQPITLSVIAVGALTGIASVGLHQLFTRTIQGLSDENKG